MNKCDSRPTKTIYKADVTGNAGYIDLIGEDLQKGQVRNTRDWRACMIRYMNVDEARGLHVVHCFLVVNKVLNKNKIIKKA